MSSAREVNEVEGDERDEIQVSEAWTWGELVREGVGAAGMYLGIALATLMVAIVGSAMLNITNTSLPRTWEMFKAGFAGTATVGLYLLPLVLLVAVVAFVGSVWKRRRLTNRYRASVEEDELQLWEEGALGERPVMQESTETILKFQQGRVSDSDLEASLDDEAGHEVTVMTEEEMYTFGEGLGEREADRVVEQLEARVFEDRDA